MDRNGRAAYPVIGWPDSEMHVVCRPADDKPFYFSP